MQKWLIGVDEAGRGPLAGPVAVGVVLVPADFDWALLPGVGDSKQLTPEKREALFRQTKELKQAGQLNFAVAMVSASVIDRIGIVPAVARAMKRALGRLSDTTINWSSSEVEVVLDGGLKAPPEFIHQQTIIKGDQSEPAIGLASIMAKVTRDTYIDRIAKQPAFLVYDLATHKGYGTKAHRALIAQHGLSTIHRVSYCKNIKIA